MCLHCQLRRRNPGLSALPSLLCSWWRRGAQAGHLSQGHSGAICCCHCGHDPLSNYPEPREFWDGREGLTVEEGPLTGLCGLERAALLPARGSLTRTEGSVAEEVAYQKKILCLDRTSLLWGGYRERWERSRRPHPSVGIPHAPVSPADGRDCG